VPLVGAGPSHGCWTSHRPNRRLLRRYYGYPQLADTKLATSTRQPLLPMFAHWSLASRHMRSWLRIPGRGWLDAASCWATDYPTAPGLQAVRAGLTIVFAVGSAAFASWVSQLPQVQQMVRAGVINVVNGFGVEAGKPLASSPRVKKVACTGDTTTGCLIMQCASRNIIPVTFELGGKSPNSFFSDVLPENDDFADKSLEGSPCSPSTRARCAPVRPGPWSSGQSTTSFLRPRRSAPRRFGRATRWTARR
jgi:hypothetical protein